MSFEITLLTGDTLPTAKPILTAYPHHLLKTAFGIGSEQQATYDLSRLEQALVDPRGAAAILHHGGKPAGVIAVESRVWESQFYPFDLGHIPSVAVAEWVADPRKAYARLLRWALIAAGQHGLQHLLCRTPAEDVPLVHALEDAGFRHMATMLLFTWRRADYRAGARVAGWLVRPVRPEEWSRLQRIAGIVFDRMLTRYTVDPQLPAAGTRRLYRAWMAESLAGNFAKVTLVVASSDSRAGFCCLKFDQELEKLLGYKVAVGTIAGPGPSPRRPGAFQALIDGAVRWSWEHEAEMFMGWTQATNYGAQQIYFKTGACIAGAYHAFHRLLGVGAMAEAA